MRRLLFASVEPATPSTDHLEALTILLDDTSPVVRESLVAHFQKLGEPALDYLRGIARGANRVAATHAQWFLSELRCSDPVVEFRNFIRSLNYELETGAILLDRTVYPSVDATNTCLTLDRIAARCRELMAEPLGSREKCRVINRVLFHELGFRGNTAHYTDPENSFIHRVLERRTGLPITLSIVYLLVAERCGLTLEPVSLPGHFVVGCYDDDQTFFIDAFDHGRFHEPEGLLAWLAGQQAGEPDVTMLAPTTVRETLCRCCRNLACHFAASGDAPMARLFAGFVTEFEDTYEQNMNP